MWIRSMLDQCRSIPLCPSTCFLRQTSRTGAYIEYFSPKLMSCICNEALLLLLTHENENLGFSSLDIKPLIRYWLIYNISPTFNCYLYNIQEAFVASSSKSKLIYHIKHHCFHFLPLRKRTIPPQSSTMMSLKPLE